MTGLIRRQTVIIVSAFQCHVALPFEIQLGCKNNVLSLNQFSALVTVGYWVYYHKTNWKKGNSTVLFMTRMSLLCQGLSVSSIQFTGALLGLNIQWYMPWLLAYLTQEKKIWKHVLLPNKQFSIQLKQLDKPWKRFFEIFDNWWTI